MKFDGTVTVGSLIHMVILLVAITTAFVRFDAAMQDIPQIKARTVRMERYLSTRDGDYWKTVHDLPDN